MEGLPLLPGCCFKDPTKTKYHRSQSLGYKNGYVLTKRPECGIGGDPIPHNQLSEKELDELANNAPVLTYGQAKQAPPDEFVPAHVAWDKKVLRFNAFFKQTVPERPDEFFRVRPVDVYYYLEDDSIAVVEPHVENSGMPQGKLIKRQRLPKNDRGDHWHWKDLNIGIDITFYGKIFHIVNCDKFTIDFLESEGVVIKPTEDCPKDPYIDQRQTDAAPQTYNTPTSFDKLKQFMDLDRKVLRFYCVWDDRDNMFGEKRPFIIHYYLVDDTLEIRESSQANDGRDPFPVLIGRHKVPKNRYNFESTFPSCVMELSNHEIDAYFTPKDFQIGKTVHIYGRTFLIYEVDDFTKGFYYHNFGMTEFNPINVKDQSGSQPQMEIPPYNNFGSMEDSLQSCLSLVPQPPKKDFIKMLENDHKVLRFEALMDSVKPEDKERRFIVSYRLADDTITIFEPPVRNSGIIGGKFLERSRIAKPGCPPEQPVFYGPQDFHLGAVIEVFKHRFIITNADEYVLKYMQTRPDEFQETTVEVLKGKIGEACQIEEQARAGAMQIRRTAGDLGGLVQQVRAQLKKIAITDKTRVDEMFLRYDKDRRGYIDVNNMRDICKKLQLPVDDDVIRELIRQCTNNPQGRIGLEDFRRFIESS